MQGMSRAIFDGATRGDQRLSDHLPAEDALPAHLRAASAEDVALDLFEVENREKVLNGFGHPMPHIKRFGVVRRTSRRKREHAEAAT